MKARGMSLIEVLVSLVILSIGVLSMAGLRLVSKRNNADAGQRTLAAQLAYGMIERMRTNATSMGLAAYLDNPVGRGQAGAEPSPQCSAADDNANPAPCTPAQLARHDLWLWEQDLDGAAEKVAGSKTGGLVFPTACITGPAGGASGFYTVSVVWRGSLRLANDPSATGACGQDPQAAGAATLYSDQGSDNAWRRAVSITFYITCRVSGAAC